MIRTLAVAAVAVFVIVLGVASPRPAQADLLAGELDVMGMSCPFCAFGIEKKLRAVPGVDGVSVLLDEGQIELRFAPGNDAAPADLRRAVEDAGFKLSGLRLEVRGTLDADPQRPVLQAGRNLRFLLVDARSGEPVSGPSLARLQAAAADGPLVLFGAVDGDGDGLPRLTLPAPDPAPAD